MAIKFLMSNKLPVTNDNIGTILGHIYKAEHIYKNDIGNLHPFIFMYINYALKTIREEYKVKNKKREVSFSEIEKTSIFEDGHKISRHEEILELIMSRNILTKTEYDVIYKIMVMQYKLKDVAKLYNVSKQRIDQVKKSAIGKLKCLKSELF